MRIGELLLEREWVDWETLAMALMQQRESDLRLCSLLVARKLIDFDQASFVLAEQHGCAAALRKHIEGRERSVAALLPTALARRYTAIPIGRAGNGKLIICMRDPSLAAREQLSRATAQSILLAVAPSRTIERLVEHVYPVVDSDVDVPIDVELSPDRDFDIDIDDDDGSGLDIDVDDADGDIPVEIEAPDALAPKTREAKARPRSQIAPPTRIKRLTTQAARDSLDETIASFPDIDDLDWLLDVLMGYVAKRWRAALLVALEDKRALGVRGHGGKLKPSATRSFILPLSEPSLVQLARDERRIVDESPRDAAKRLPVTLDNAQQPTAAPITVNGHITHVLVVGDPLAGDHDATIRDLEVLTEALDDALARITR